MKTDFIVLPSPLFIYKKLTRNPVLNQHKSNQKIGVDIILSRWQKIGVAILSQDLDFPPQRLELQ
jgi:hypothetical protein